MLRSLKGPLSNRAVLLLIAIGTLFVVLEISARAYQHISGRTFDDALYGTHYRDYFFTGPSYKPLGRGRWQGVSDLQINSMGFRGDEFAISKPAGEFRIVTFGGSTSVSGDYPAKLQLSLDKQPAEFSVKVKVINAAVPGWNTTQSLIQFITRAVYLSPDIILVYHAINDWHQPDDKWLKSLPEVDYRRYNGFLENSSLLYVFVRNRLRRAVEWITLRATEFSPNNASSVDEDKVLKETLIFRTNLAHFVALAKYRGIQIVFVTMPLNYDEENRRRAGLFCGSVDGLSIRRKKVNMYNSIIRDIAQREGVGFIDVAATGFSKDATNFVDLCHFSEQGAQIFADLVAAGLRERIPSRSAVH